MKILRLTLGVALLALVTIGCKSTDQSDAPAGLSRANTDYVNKVWIAPGKDLKGYETIVLSLPDIKTATLSGDELERVSLFQTNLFREITSALQRRQVFVNVVTNQTEATSGTKSVELDITLSKYNRGNMAYLKVEGQLKEAQATEPVVAFEDVERLSRYVSTFYSPRTIVRDEIYKLANNIANVISAAVTVPQVAQPTGIVEEPLRELPDTTEKEIKP